MSSTLIDESEVFKIVSERVSSSLPALIEEYRGRFGKQVATDLAREIFPEYTASTETRLALASAVQKPSALLADAVFTQMVNEKKDWIMRENMDKSQKNCIKDRADHRSISVVSEYREPKLSAAQISHEFAEAAASNIRHSVGELRRSGALMSVGE